MTKPDLGFIFFWTLLRDMQGLDRPISYGPFPLALADLLAREAAIPHLYGDADFTDHVWLVENEAERIRSTQVFRDLEQQCRARHFYQDIGWATRAIVFQSEVDGDRDMSGVCIGTSPHLLVARPSLAVKIDTEGNCIEERLHAALREPLASRYSGLGELYVIPNIMAVNPLSIWIVWPRTMQINVKSLANSLQTLLNDTVIQDIYRGVIEDARRQA